MTHRSLCTMMLTLATCICLFCQTQASQAFTLNLPEDFPNELRGCFGNSVSELLVTDRNDTAAVRNLFFSHIDKNLLGARAVGGNAWKNASDAWRAAALNLYFELVFGSGSKAVKNMNASAVVISAKMAIKPEVHKPNQWHLVISIDQGNDHIGAAVLMSKNCKVFDFAQGDWASNHLDANDVDLVVPVKDRKRK